MCCETEEPDNIKAFMDAAGIKPVKKCLNMCYDLQGAIYEIPNYCLNPPALYDIKPKDTNKPEEKILNVIEIFKFKLRLRNLNSEFILKISNYVKIENLIDTIVNYLKNEDKTVEIHDVKLFYCGKELKREDDLWNYKINEENIVQIFNRKLI